MHLCDLVMLYRISKSLNLVEMEITKRNFAKLENVVISFYTKKFDTILLKSRLNLFRMSDIPLQKIFG